MVEHTRRYKVVHIYSLLACLPFPTPLISSRKKRSTRKKRLPGTYETHEQLLNLAFWLKKRSRTNKKTPAYYKYEQLCAWYRTYCIRNASNNSFLQFCCGCNKKLWSGEGNTSWPRKKHQTQPTKCYLSTRTQQYPAVEHVVVPSALLVELSNHQPDRRHQIRIDGNNRPKNVSNISGHTWHPRSFIGGLY